MASRGQLGLVAAREVLMIAAWCFQCGLDYAQDVAECVECGVPTVSHPPSLASAMDDGDTHVAYELHAWNGSARAAVENQLYRAHVSHRWEGPTLLVLETDEDAVDDIIGEVDDAMATTADEGVATEGGRVGFDLGARNQELQAVVAARLTEAAVDYELMGNGFLLVDSAHEDEVGDWIEEIQEELRATATFGPGVDGVDSHEVVESMFLAADVLRRNTRDPRSQRRMLESESLAQDLKLPFGYEAPMWRSVLQHAAVLVALIEDAAEDSLIESEAAELRSILHPYV